MKLERAARQRAAMADFPPLNMGKSQVIMALVTGCLAEISLV
jgi:hypothetical protein